MQRARTHLKMSGIVTTDMGNEKTCGEHCLCSVIFTAMSVSNCGYSPPFSSAICLSLFASLSILHADPGPD